MKIMNELIEDYELKLEVILEMIKEKEIEGINSVKLNAIARCYKGFLKDLNQALNIDLVSKSFYCFSEEAKCGRCNKVCSDCEKVK